MGWLGVGLGLGGCNTIIESNHGPLVRCSRHLPIHYNISDINSNHTFNAIKIENVHVFVAAYVIQRNIPESSLKKKRNETQSIGW